MGSCRCGHQGEGPHPCHQNHYRCGKPAKQRFYNAQLSCLAGAQLKFGASETWACDECWIWFLGAIGKQNDATLAQCEKTTETTKT